MRRTVPRRGPSPRRQAGVGQVINCVVPLRLNSITTQAGSPPGCTASRAPDAATLVRKHWSRLSANAAAVSVRPDPGAGAGDGPSPRRQAAQCLDSSMSDGGLFACRRFLGWFHIEQGGPGEPMHKTISMPITRFESRRDVVVPAGAARIAIPSSARHGDSIPPIESDAVVHARRRGLPCTGQVADHLAHRRPAAPCPSQTCVRRRPTGSRTSRLQSDIETANTTAGGLDRGP